MAKEEITITTTTDVTDSEGNLITSNTSSDKMIIEIDELKDSKRTKGYSIHYGTYYAK